MDWLLISLLIIGSIFGLYLFYFLIKKNKKHFIPSLIFLLFGFILIMLSQSAEVSGGFLDVIYMLFGVFSVFISIILLFIVLLIQSRRKHKK